MDKICKRRRHAWRFATPRHSCHEKVNIVVSVRDVTSPYYNKEALISRSIQRLRHTVYDMLRTSTFLSSICPSWKINSGWKISMDKAKVEIEANRRKARNIAWNKRRSIACSRGFRLLNVLKETLHYLWSTLASCLLPLLLQYEKATGEFSIYPQVAYPTYLTHITFFI